MEDETPADFISLPNEILLSIIDKMDISDALNLRLTSKKFAALLPKPTFFNTQYKTSSNWPRFNPVDDSKEPFFELSRNPVKKLSIKVNWNDQGWGNRKGNVILGTTVEGKAERVTLFKTASHEPEIQTISAEKESQVRSLIGSSDRGSKLQFFAQVGMLLNSGIFNYYALTILSRWWRGP
eukprot:m.53369 g.53369  ORF g.53369 m.53369 type:complete len:181 (+) comp10864_c0_seq3:143-685(+)